MKRKEECPTIWFLRLEIAKTLVDAESVKRCTKKLRELGFEVKPVENSKREKIEVTDE